VQPHHWLTLTDMMATIPFLLVSHLRVAVVVVRRLVLKPETLVGQVVVLLHKAEDLIWEAQATRQQLHQVKEQQAVIL